MWEPSDIIALAAVAVAGISLAYTWWDRRTARPESYRAALYGRQLSVTDEFVAMVREAHQELLEDRSAADAPIHRMQGRLAEFAVSSVFIPPEVIHAGADWVKESAEAVQAEASWQMASAAGSQQGASPLPEEASRRGRLDDAWRRFVRRVRTEIGADELHRQVRELTGAADAERRKRDRLARIHLVDIRLEVMSRGLYKAPSVEQLRRELRDEL